MFKTYLKRHNNRVDIHEWKGGLDKPVDNEHVINRVMNIVINRWRWGYRVMRLLGFKVRLVWGFKVYKYHSEYSPVVKDLWISCQKRV